MKNKNLTFEQLPNAVTQLFLKLERIEGLLPKEGKNNHQQESDKWFSLDEVIKYDPAKRKKATWYSLVSRGVVPYHKNGKHLVFLKSEIDAWLKQGRKKTNDEIEAEARAFLSNSKTGGNGKR